MEKYIQNNNHPSLVNASDGLFGLIHNILINLIERKNCILDAISNYSQFLFPGQ